MFAYESACQRPLVELADRGPSVPIDVCNYAPEVGGVEFFALSRSRAESFVQLRRDLVPLVARSFISDSCLHCADHAIGGRCVLSLR